MNRLAWKCCVIATALCTSSVGALASVVNVNIDVRELKDDLIYGDEAHPFELEDTIQFNVRAQPNRMFKTSGAFELSIWSLVWLDSHLRYDQTVTLLKDSVPVYQVSARPITVHSTFYGSLVGEGANYVGSFDEIRFTFSNLVGTLTEEHTITTVYGIDDVKGIRTVYADDGSVPAVPEPATYAMWVGGLAALLALHRRRNSGI